jgi:hypothetical protein
MTLPIVDGAQPGERPVRKRMTARGSNASAAASSRRKGVGALIA